MKHIHSLSSESTLTNVQDEDIQPNAVDLRLDKVFKINNNIFEISNDVKMHRGSTQLPVDERDCFILQPGTYEFIMENEVSIGEHEAGFVLTRSTLIRNGCNLITGLYDSGYCGVIGGQLNVQGGWAVIKRGTRIGQFILFDAESLHKYNGDYGANKAHDDKYEVK